MSKGRAKKEISNKKYNKIIENSNKKIIEKELKIIKIKQEMKEDAEKYFKNRPKLSQDEIEKRCKKQSTLLNKIRHYYLFEIREYFAHDIFTTDTGRQWKDIANTKLALLLFVFFSIFFNYINTVNGIVYIIISHYIILIILQIKNPKELSNIVINFLGLISLYNILLSLNLLNMTELSSDYIVSNLVYFNMSFLLLSFGYNFYEKILFIIDSIFEISQYHTVEIIFLAIEIILILLIFVLFLILPINNGVQNVSHIVYGYLSFIIFLSIIIFIYIKFNKNNLSYKKIKEGIINNQNKISKYNDLIIDVLNIASLKKEIYLYTTIYSVIKLDVKEEIFKAIKIILNIFSNVFKIFPLFILTIALLNNKYLLIYFEENKECLNENLKNELIIKLKNNNVLIEKLENGKFYLKELPCEREPKKIEIRKINW